MKASSRTNDSKMQELILHVAITSENDPNFGAVKLNKILFYADFLSYLRRGRSVTDQEYFALEEGPAPVRLVPIREKMKAREDIAIKRVNRFGLPQQRIEALRPPDYSKLGAEDIEIANLVLGQLKNKNGRDVTDASHQFAGWQIAFGKGERTRIPYGIVRFDPTGFLSPIGITGFEVPPLPQELIDYGHKLDKRLAS